LLVVQLPLLVPLETLLLSLSMLLPQVEPLKENELNG